MAPNSEYDACSIQHNSEITIAYMTYQPQAQVPDTACRTLRSYLNSALLM